jgi:hypothetical protein
MGGRLLPIRLKPSLAVSFSETRNTLRARAMRVAVSLVLDALRATSESRFRFVQNIKR